MGNVNATCAVTGLSIREEEKVVFIPMINAYLSHGHTHDSLDPRTMFFSSTELYHPFFFGVKGSYDGCGGLIDIEENATTQIIEKMFKVSTEKLIEFIASQSSEEEILEEQPFLTMQKVHFLQSMSGIYIHGDIYTEISKGFFNNSKIVPDRSKELKESLADFKADFAYLKKKYRGKPYDLEYPKLSQAKGFKNYFFMDVFRCNMPQFDLLYIPRILFFEELEAEVIEFYYVLCNMNILNRIFQPQLSQGSEVNDSEMTALMEKSLSILKERKSN